VEVGAATADERVQFPDSVDLLKDPSVRVGDSGASSSHSTFCADGFVNMKNLSVGIIFRYNDIWLFF